MGIKGKGEIRRVFFFKKEEKKLERKVFPVDKGCMNYSEASFPLYRAP